MIFPKLAATLYSACIIMGCNIILLSMDRQYHTIDPLIMETLNLNQRRITHIFDILHGKDSQPYS